MQEGEELMMLDWKPAEQ